MHMESSKPKSPQKSVKNSSQFAVPSIGKAAKSVSPQQPLKTKSWSKDELKDRCGDKHKVLGKPLTKENTKPMEIKLQTKERAIKRTLFNYTVATKLYLIEQQKRQIEKLQKVAILKLEQMLEEEEVRMLRKEMVPRAQLMPLFDRPFYPQRSTTPLTIPKEPSFHIISKHSFSCSDDIYSFQHNEAH